MDESKIVSAKIPGDVYKEMLLRVPEGDRSEFIRDAIMDKLQKTPRPDKILDVEKRVDKIEKQLAEIRKYLADLELLTYDRGQTNPHTFAVDEMDHKIIDYLTHYKGATTPELAEYLKTGKIEWFIKMQKICPLAGLVFEDKTLLKSHIESAKREIRRLADELDSKALDAILKKDEPETFKIDLKQCTIKKSGSV